MKAKLIDLYFRLVLLLVKILSVKGLILGLSTWLLYEGKIDGTIWVLSAGAVIGGRAFEKGKNGLNS